jgi:putative FmdB family regulatory protein
MPNYEFMCEACETFFEEFTHIDDPFPACPSCEGKSKRLISLTAKPTSLSVSQGDGVYSTIEDGIRITARVVGDEATGRTNSALDQAARRASKTGNKDKRGVVVDGAPYGTFWGTKSDKIQENCAVKVSS